MIFFFCHHSKPFFFSSTIETDFFFYYYHRTLYMYLKALIQALNKCQSKCHFCVLILCSYTVFLTYMAWFCRYILVMGTVLIVSEGQCLGCGIL